MDRAAVDLEKEDDEVLDLSGGSAHIRELLRRRQNPCSWDEVVRTLT
jgi:hypothetical protein